MEAAERQHRVRSRDRRELSELDRIACPIPIRRRRDDPSEWALRVSRPADGVDQAHEPSLAGAGTYTLSGFWDAVGAPFQGVPGTPQVVTFELAPDLNGECGLSSSTCVTARS